MDNYLSHRWPNGLSGTALPQLPRKQVRKWPRRLAFVLGVLLGISLVVVGGYWVGRQMGAMMVPRPDSSQNPDLPSRPSRHIQPDDWQPEDLPWGDCDPSVQVSLSPSAGPVLSTREIYRRALPSVVCVETTCADGYGTGSGVVLTADGYILTNYHVIDEGLSIDVMLLSDQSTLYPAKVVGYDVEYDLAVLKVEADGLQPIAIGDSRSLAVGDQVFALGNPMGYLYGSFTEGIVSALDRESNSDTSALAMIQTSAALNQGNSGGALLDERGKLVGIPSAKLTGIEDDAVIEGIGLAIPISDALPFVNHILAYGKTMRPSIGITCYATYVDQVPGLMVREVQKEVPAQEAGLLSGDFIVAANGQAVPTVASLRRILAWTGAGGEVTCTILRDGTELDLTFSLIDTFDTLSQ